ncbi:ABC transporter permease subunit [Cohnella silvisoli]|uniref:ABC transporter permease subunit n=2 Tax=Cohnella silvisoli TaxID=2873699 RepID=A0ABV1KRC5_9BACL|nr:ABC transporter permease subunit [Cohnella silvisoli]
MARRLTLIQNISKYKYLYLIGVPGMVFFLIFKYLPMLGIVIAFEDYSPVKGVWSSNWVGIKHFDYLFGDPKFWRILRNTLSISGLSLLILFPAPILLALMMNEVRNQIYKRFIQTLVFFPHFLSWVIVISLSYFFLSSEEGIINKLIASLNGTRISFLLQDVFIYPILMLQGLWKEVGWNIIIYLAAIAGINPTLYEAATIDGAGRLAQIRHITIPSIIPTIVILFILSLSNILEVNFEQVLLMQNAVTLHMTEVIDTYVYKIGVREGKFSYSTAVGVFKSFVGLIAVLAANRLIRRTGHEGIW